MAGISGKRVPESQLRLLKNFGMNDIGVPFGFPGGLGLSAEFFPYLDKKLVGVRIIFVFSGR